MLGLAAGAGRSIFARTTFSLDAPIPPWAKAAQATVAATNATPISCFMGEPSRTLSATLHLGLASVCDAHHEKSLFALIEAPRRPRTRSPVLKTSRRARNQDAPVLCGTCT